MGPPTISADQRCCLCSRAPTAPRSFNGAADDLGGSTASKSASLRLIFSLQWGRRRSRRINLYAPMVNNSYQIQASMGPPTISADQPKPCKSLWSSPRRLQWGRRRSRRINPPLFCWVFLRRKASMGPPTISADQPHTVVLREEVLEASMGPPTISADQRVRQRRRSVLWRCFNGAADDLGGSTVTADLAIRRSSCFNGAADDLGGSTDPGCSKQPKSRKLQWGRRRSRRINGDAGSDEVLACAASMGPPTISADQRLQRLRERDGEVGFNGAADDLGGSTTKRRVPKPLTPRFNGAADDLGGSTPRFTARSWRGFPGENREPTRLASFSDVPTALIIPSHRSKIQSPCGIFLFREPPGFSPSIQVRAS